jgi:PPM family protein phosphatase
MPEPTKKINIIYSAKSDVGLVRNENQDSFGIFPDENTESGLSRGQLFIVADGMGGHERGKEASLTAVKVVSDEYYSSSFEEGVALKAAIEKANSAIFNKTGKRYEFSRMGTTCSALAINNDKMVIGHVGDSRIYRIENNNIVQLTRDHTKVMEMLREGLITPEEARNYPSKSVLARAVGIDEDIRVDIIDDLSLKKGQSYVLCSDGMAKVSKGEILNIVQNNNPSDACNLLVGLANERGGKDNITVIVIKTDHNRNLTIPPDRPVKRKKIKRQEIKSPVRNRSGWSKVIIVFVIILILLALQYKDSLFPSSGTSIVRQTMVNKTDESETNSKPTIDPEYSEKKLIDEADRLLKEKDYNNAYLIYKSLLSSQSYQKQASGGINEIVSAYLSAGDNYVNDKNFREALKYYRKAEKIQPDNNNIKSLIKLCTDQINYEEPPPVSPPVKTTEPLKTVTSSRFTVSRFDTPGWIYPGMAKSECSVSSKEIDFTNTLSERFIIYSKDLFDVTISASVYTDNPGSAAGLVIGYASPLDYYVFKYLDGGSYILQRVKGNEIKNLLEIKPKDSVRPGVRKMKIIYSNNLISIYDQNGFLNSYKSIWGIFGKSGIYIGKNSSAKFNDISIAGNTNLE